MLNAISATLYGSLELPGVFHKAARMVSELMSADITLLYIAEETTQVLQLVASEGISPESVLEIKKIEGRRGYMRASGQTGQGLIVENDIGKQGEFSGIFIRLNIHTHMVIPLVFQERVSGVICIGVHPPKQFTNYDRDFDDFRRP